MPMSLPADEAAGGRPPATTVATRIDAQAVRVAVAGDLDRTSAATLTLAVERLVRDTALASIVLDLTDLRFVDASGARALPEARATCSAVNGAST
ncbi:STAS domain-containing protein [Cryptosporangium japonicum]|uniref:STAS domain-containing protein n=1 Tax=Cryptosporangium japonicum TaxID=80872 RepID=A0ABP3EN46_9ACTN